MGALCAVVRVAEPPFEWSGRTVRAPEAGVRRRSPANLLETRWSPEVFSRTWRGVR